MVNESRQNLHKRALGIAASAAVLIVAVITYGVTVLEKVRAIESHWETFSAITIKRDEQIHRIQQELGYGGLIHNFKNFVLRDDPKHLDQANENLEQIYDAVSILHSYDLSEAEIDALDAVLSTIKAYETRLIIADDAFAEGMSSNQVDSLVIVDDTAAFAALKVLSRVSAERLKQVEEETERQLNDTIRFAAVGLLVVPLILLISYILYRSVRSLIAANTKAHGATQRLEGLLDTSPEAMIVTNAEGIIVRSNKAAETLMEYEQGELLEKQLSILVAPEQRQKHIERYQQFVSTPQFGVREISGDINGVTKSGREFPVEVSLSALEQDGALLITASVRDVTLRQAYENALMEARERAIAASNAKSDFLANMSHEIRTPINAVIGLSCLALKTKLDARQLDYTNKIYSSGRRLLDVVNDILDFSKIEAGKMDIAQTRFSLSNVIRDVAAMTTASIEEKGIELIFRISPEIPDSLIGDPLRLGQVFSNLVSNAIKFTDTGGVVVKGELAPKDDGSKALRFSVIDTGIGIPEDQVTDLFEAFTQADTSATRRFGGTGLGLAICKSIIEGMGGELSFESTPGTGSTFSFTIPLEEDRVVDASGDPLARINPENIRILVVDDSDLSCRIMKEEISALGFPVDTSNNGEDAVSKVEVANDADQPYSLLLLDWRMPGIDGLETVRLIEKNQGIRKMPMVFLVTAFSSDDVRTKAGDLPIAAFMDKPLNTSLLINRLVTALSRNEFPDTSDDPDEMNAVSLLEEARGKRVLVVEDNAINQQVAREILENEGLIIDTADNGRIALDLLFNKGPEIYSAILMDIQMPEMDGITATQEIRTDPSFNDVPIIALTAHALKEDRQRCLDVGMNGFLTKPVIANDLIATLNVWINGVEAQAESGLEPQVRGQVADVPDATQDNDADIMSLPIINLEKASSISNLSQDFLEELLCDFKDRYEETSQTVRQHLDAGERTEAKSIAHTVKGISGSLGAEQVYASAVALDAGLKEDAPDEVIEDLYGNFNASMEALLDYIGNNIVRPE